MKVTLMASNLGNNAYGRTHILAQALARIAEVEIVGLTTTDPPIWPVFDSGEFKVKVFRAQSLPKVLATLPKMINAISGDMVYACKPLPASMWPALAWQRNTGKPMWLDIDDDEWGRYRAAPLWKKCLAPFNLLYSPSHTRTVRFAQPVARFANQITVSSHYLQQRYGGAVIPHGRDTDRFNPEKFGRNGIRHELGVSDKFVVLFQGTPRLHKGLGMLVNALNALNGKIPIHLLLVGADASHPVARQLMAQAPRLFGDPARHFLGVQPFERVPYFLAAADLVALPQEDSPFAQGQLPAKLFDAMAMGCPVVAGAVSDVARILDGCGWVVPPGNQDALQAALLEAWQQPEQRRDYGERSRQRCIDHYSLNAMAKRFEQLLAQQGRNDR